mgnify:CR=1 FL=1
MILPMISHLQTLFKEALHRAYPNSPSAAEMEVTPSTQDKFGHYQFNSAMKLAKALGEPPRTIAEKIVAALERGDTIEKTEIAGPGFINIFLKNEICIINIRN